MKHVLAAVFLAVIAALPFGAQAGQAEPLKVVATFSIIGDMARQVGGDIAQVRTLVGPDSDAHTYKPTPDDSRALAEADLVIANGLGMEGWVARLVTASGFKGLTITASDGVSPRESSAGEAGKEGDAHHHHKAMHDGHTIDPHAWQDVANARIYARNIAAALGKLRPSEAQAIAERAKAYDAELEKLDAWVRAELEDIHPKQRKIITSHDAFGYFGAAYGVIFLSPQGLSTEIEPTATDVARLIEQMKSHKVRRVFFENMASQKLVKQLAKDAGATVGAPVYSDALSDASGPAGSYVAMVRHNTALFKEAMAINGK